MIEFAEQAGIQILATGEDTQGRVVGPIIGTLDIQQALRLLVASTGLELKSFDGTTAVLRRRRLAARSPIRPVPPSTPRRIVEDLSIATKSLEVAKPPDIVVVGTRLGSVDGYTATVGSEEIKRRSLQTLSVLTSDDLERLPDTSLASVLRRVPGMQVSTSAGGGTVRVHGLGQVEERVNGRNLTSTVGRGYDVAALPSDLVSGIDVYKTPSASLIEGGIGGQVDFHTRRPFDFKGASAAASLQSGYSDINRSVQPFVSGYVTGRRDIGFGEIGLLVGGAFQREAVGQRLVSSFNTIIARESHALVAPGTLNKTYFNGIKQLSTAYGSVQWRPATFVTVTGDFIYNSSSLDFVHQTLSADLEMSPDEKSHLVAGGGADYAIATGAFENVPIRSTTRRDDAIFETRQAGLGAKIDGDRLTLFAEASYTNTGYRSISPSATLSAKAPSLSFNVGSRRPDYQVSGLDLTNSAGWSYAGFGEYHGRYSSTEWAYRADAFRSFAGAIKTLKGGVRFDRRTVATDYGLRTIVAPADMVPPAAPYVSLTDGSFAGGQPRWLAPSTALLRQDTDSVRAFFGAPSGPPAYAGVNAFRGIEEVWNSYLEATFGFSAGGIRIDGNAGVRYAGTSIKTIGTQAQHDGTFLPISAGQRYENWLPQINVRAQLSANALMRLAWSRQLTRPDFLTFSPGYSLNFETRTGGAGNPAIRPLTASQYDASIEWYLSENSNLYVAGFYKRVNGFIGYHSPGGFVYTAAFYKKLDGFIQRSSALENFNGSRFLISRPFNGGTASVRGFEIGANERLVFLPGVLKNLGIDTNFTYVDGKQSDTTPATGDTLLNASKYTYNVSGYFEYQKLSLRLNYSGRSHMLINQSLPESFTMQDWLDFSARYRLSSNVELIGNATNLGTPLRRSYYLNPDLPLSISRPLRRFEVGVRVRL